MSPSGAMMFFSLGQVFWGLLFVILDININRFDFLPDFVGYILVALGCRGLITESTQFSIAGILSWVLAAIDLLGYPMRGSVGPLFGVVSVIVDCAMMWFLLGGVMELTASRERADLSARASNRRMAYVVLMALATLAGFAAQGSRGDALIVALILVACGLVLLVLILHLIHRVRREIAYDLI